MAKRTAKQLYQDELNRPMRAERVIWFEGEDVEEQRKLDRQFEWNRAGLIGLVVIGSLAVYASRKEVEG